MVSVSFVYPGFLLLLLIVPLFIIIYFLSLAYTKKKAVIFSNFEAVERIFGIEMFSKNFLALYINIAILCLMIFSIAGTVVSFETKTSSFSYVIAIDNSGSMKTKDIYPTRLDSAVESAKRFVDLLPIGTEVGVIEFAGDAKVLKEIDTSKIKTNFAIDSIEFGEIQGTNIYNAVVVANKLFGTSTAKAIILISDGQLNVGDAPQVIRYATRNNIIINTLAVGTEEGGLTEFNTLSKLDEDTLKSLAFNTEGDFFKISEEEDFDSSFNSILSGTDKEVSIDISLYLIFAALFLFIAGWLLHNFRFRIVP